MVTVGTETHQQSYRLRVSKTKYLDASMHIKNKSGLVGHGSPCLYPSTREVEVAEVKWIAVSLRLASF